MKQKSGSGPKISVSIITYNHQEYIREALESVLIQEGDFDLEIVVGEDYSTDKTREIVEEFALKYPDIIKPIYQEINVGHYQNFVDVINLCSGDYIAQLDGDDYMLPNKLQKQIEFMQKHKECALVFHNLKLIGEWIKDNTFNNPLSEKETIVDIDKFVEIGLAHWGNSSKLYRRSCFPPEGILNELRCIGDQHLHLQNARFGKIGYIPEVLGVYRKHSNGLSQRNKNIDQIDCALRDLVLTYKNAYRYGVARDIVDRRLAFVYYDTACQYLLFKEYYKFLSSIDKSYENQIFYNNKHKICYWLRSTPRLLYLLKFINDLINRAIGRYRV